MSGSFNLRYPWTTLTQPSSPFASIRVIRGQKISFLPPQPVLVVLHQSIGKRNHMTALKEEVVTLVQGLPDSTTLDDILAEIYFKAQVDTGLRELDEGKGIPHEVVEKRMSKWLAA